MRYGALLGGLVGLALCFAPTADTDSAAQVTGFPIVGIEPPAGYVSTSAVAINESGQVVGTMFEATPGEANAYKFVPSGEGGVLTNLGSIPPSDEGCDPPCGSVAYDINRAGAVVGTSGLARWSGFSGPAHAFLSSGTGMTDLGTMAHGDAEGEPCYVELLDEGSPPRDYRGNYCGSIARAISNSTGMTVGQSQWHAYWSAQRAFVFSGLDLGTLGEGDAEGDPCYRIIPAEDETPERRGNGCFSGATDVNDSGQVVGASQSFLNALSQTAGHFEAACVGPEGDCHAFRYDVFGTGGMVDLGTLPSARSSYATAINNAGQIVGYAGFKLSGVPATLQGFFLDGDGEMIPLAQLPPSSRAYGVPLDINEQGQIAGYSQTFNAIGDAGRRRATMWSCGITLDLNDLLTSGSGWWLDTAEDINENGQIAGNGTYLGENRGYILNGPLLGGIGDSDGDGSVDDDGDSLCDNWETDGLDVNGDGIAELDLPSLGADPEHRDLFVEVDFMEDATHNARPSADALQAVEQAFADAPVTNPDGTSGIALHVLLDEAVPHSDEMGFPGQIHPDCTAASFDGIRTSWFGAAGDRGSPLRLQARRLAFRYAVFGHRSPDSSENDACADDLTSGSAENPGDDFYVTLGGWSDAQLRAAKGRGCLESETDLECGRREAEAGAFMHGLGHTLDLGHGGDDEVNCKPNYPSVMSFAYQTPSIDPVRRLDYSGTWDLAFLDEEGFLEEPVGVGGSPGDHVIWGVNGIPYVAPSDGPIDWNGDGDVTDTDAAGDINRIDGLCEADGVNFYGGSNDWESLQFNIRTEPDFAAGVHGTATTDEVTGEQILAAAVAADTDGDEYPNTLDNCPTAANPGQEDSDGDGLGNACEVGEPGNTAPVANAGPDQGVNEGAIVTLDGGDSSDPDAHTIATFEWTQVAGPPVVLTPSGDSVTFTPMVDDAYEFDLRVTDQPGLQSTPDRVRVTVANVLPIVTAPGTQTATAGAATNFGLGSFADPGADSPWNVSISWGDGSSTPFASATPGSLGSAAHAFASAGTFFVTLNVADDDGSSSATFQVAVAPAPGPAAVECIVPKLLKKTLRAAKAALAAAHCQLGPVKKKFSAKIKKGRVMKQTKAPGLHLPDGAKIGITLSKGRRPS